MIDRAKVHAALDLLLDALQEAAQPIQSRGALERVTLRELSKQVGVTYGELYRACKSYEAGNPAGLRCGRKTPRKENSPLYTTLAWYEQWVQTQGEMNRVVRDRAA
jgi:hypothetical protein